MQNKAQNINTLDIYRRRMRFSTRHVARLLGDKDISRLSKYERGQRLPDLRNAFRLSIILRVPVEFLFPSLYASHLVLIINRNPNDDSRSNRDPAAPGVL